MSLRDEMLMQKASKVIGVSSGGRLAENRSPLKSKNFICTKNNLGNLQLTNWQAQVIFLVS